MGSWPTVKLREVAEKRGLIGGPFGSSLGKRDYVADGVPVIRGQNLATSARFWANDFVFVTPAKCHTELARNTAEPGDVIFTQRGTLGQVGIIPAQPYPVYVISQSQMRLRVDPCKAVAEYIYYCFTDEAMKRTIEARAITTGVPHINLGILADLEIPLPPLPEQKAIAEVLGALDDKIEANRNVSALLETRLAAMFAARCFDEPGTEPVRLESLVAVAPPCPRPSGEAAPYIDMASVPTSSALIASWAVREPRSGSRFLNGDTIMARITPCLENGKVAYIDCLPDGATGVGSTEFIVLRPAPWLPRQFAYFLARSPRFRDFAVQRMSGSSGRQRCPSDAIAGYPIAVPDSTAIGEFAIECEPAFRFMRGLVAEGNILVQLRDTLLPKLLSGELRVRDAEDLVEEAV